MPPLEIGLPATRLVTLPTLQATPDKSGVRGTILLFDRFGNAITNITAADLAAHPKENVVATCNGRAFTFVDHYQAGKSQPAISLINSDDQLELSVFGQSAQQLFHLKVGDDVRLGKQEKYKARL